MNGLQLVGAGLLVVCTVLSVASVVVYALMPWRTTAFGRHLFAYMAVLAAVLLLSCVPLVWHDPAPWFNTVGLGIFAGMPIVLYWRFAIIWGAWRQQQADRRDTQEAEQPKAF